MHYVPYAHLLHVLYFFMYVASIIAPKWMYQTRCLPTLLIYATSSRNKPIKIVKIYQEVANKHLKHVHNSLDKTKHCLVNKTKTMSSQDKSFYEL